MGKVKGKYDATCQELEGKRKKAETHYDKAKTQNAYQQQIYEMNNAKNSYLISIRVTNKQKEKYYHEYIPEVMDSLQDLNEFRTIKLNSIWTVASQLEGEMLQQSYGMMAHLTSEIGRNLPHLDSMMYMRHNIGGFNEPPDKVFEASPVWHDDDSMIVDETAKIYLRNVLSKSKSSLGELRREVDKKRREVENVRRLKERVREGTEKKDEVEVVRMLFSLQEDLHATDHQRLVAEVETSTITSAVGDVTLGAKNHNFKGQTFKIPTNCDLCGERIWGLSAKGFDCRDCGYTCHSKCEMKVPPDCPGEQTKDERKKLKAQRQAAATQLLKPDMNASTTSHNTHPSIAELPDLARSNTMNSLSSHSARRSISGQLSPTDEAPPPPGEAAPRPSISSAKSGTTMKRNRVMAPPPTAYISELPGSSMNGGADRGEKRGKMLYGFDASGEGELTVAEGKEVILVEDDGKYIREITRPFIGMRLTLHRRLRMGQGPRKPQRRHCPSILRRFHYSHPFSNTRRPCPSCLGLLNINHLLRRRSILPSRRSQKERPSRSTEARRQETPLRRSSVRVHRSRRYRALHVRRREVCACQG